MSVLKNLNIQETIIHNAAIARGVSEEELMTYEKQEALIFKRKLFELGKKVFPSNLSVKVNPLNYIQENLPNFERVYPWIEKQKLEFRYASATFAKEIELIGCEPAEISATLKEIDERGYVSVPSPFVLGLGVEHSHLLKEYYGYVTSLDGYNLLNDMSSYSSFLCLDFCNIPRIGLVKSDGKFSRHCRFAVVSKEIEFLRWLNVA